MDGDQCTHEVGVAGLERVDDRAVLRERPLDRPLLHQPPPHPGPHGRAGQAVEQALQLKEGTEEEVTVTALTVGPEKAADAVRKALQMGADQGVHVTDEAIAGSDAIATSLVLAKAVEKIGEGSPVDVVLCGMASTDGAMSVVPAMLAERLN